jgi:hypothetical protein
MRNSSFHQRGFGLWMAVAGWAFAVVVGLSQPTAAKSFKEMFPGTELTNDEAQAIVEAMDCQQGVVALGTGGVQLDVPSKYYVLGPVDAKRVLVEVWGNPRAIQFTTCEAGANRILTTSDAPEAQDERADAVRSFASDPGSSHQEGPPV